jgi:hypothetical protein
VIWSVWAVDPGARTGWAWCCVSLRELRASDPLQLLPAVHGDARFTAGEITAPVDDTVSGIVDRMGKVRAELGRRWPELRYTEEMVIEGFVMSPKAKRASARLPERLAAALTDRLGSEFEVAEQLPGTKAVVSDDRLKRFGLWVPGKPHAMDAVRHLVVRLRILSDLK